MSDKGGRRGIDLDRTQTAERGRSSFKVIASRRTRFAPISCIPKEATRRLIRGLHICRSLSSEKISARRLRRVGKRIWGSARR